MILLQTPSWIVEAGTSAISSGFTKYVNPSGTTEIKQAIAKHFTKTRGVTIGMDRVVVGPGAKPGLWFGFQAIASQGDEILCPDPGFPSYENMVKCFGCTAVKYDALANEVGAELKQHITSKTKAVILNSPSNPTGRVYSQEDLAKIAGVMQNYENIWIISDEIYCHLIYDHDDEVEYPFDYFPTSPSIAVFPNMLDRTIVVDGFSKTFQMTGWRLGFVICNPELASKLHLLMTHAIGCTASFTQVAGIAALTNPNAGKALSDVIKEYKQRRNYVVSRLNAMSGISCETPKGAFYAFADVSKCGISARELCDKFLNEGFVAILPGGDFGSKGENFIRISYVGTLETLKEGLDRMEKVVLSLSSFPSTKKIKLF